MLTFAALFGCAEKVTFRLADSATDSPAVTDVPVTPDAPMPPDTVMCAPGTHRCGEFCAPDTAVTSCGASCSACPVPPVGMATCVAGRCGVACPAGATLCGSACVTTASDAANCGTCGRACAAGQVCSLGACTTVCAAGTTLCGSNCITLGASCTSTGSGGCAQSGTTACVGGAVQCTATPRTSGACTAPAGGVCNASGVCACAAGTTLCGSACVATASDAANCGTCGRACAAGQSCSGGLCAVRCGDGIVGSGETCDDGNTVSGDGCSATCQAERACSAVSFDGTVSCASGSQLGPVITAPFTDHGGRTTLTIEAWVRLTNYTQYGTAFAITNGSLTTATHVSRTGIGVAGDIGYGANRNRWGSFSAFSTSVIPLATWQHVAIVHNGGTLAMYVNGILQGTSSTPFPTASASDTFVVGSDPGQTCVNSNTTLNGFVKEVRISATARYSSSFTPVTRLAADADTLLLWHLDEGAGASAVDASGRGRNGTLLRGASWVASCPP